MTLLSAVHQGDPRRHHRGRPPRRRRRAADVPLHHVPSIRPSLIVVLTTISITTLKAFDIVRTATGGNFDTSVLAYEFYVQSFRVQQRRARRRARHADLRAGHADRHLQRPSDAQAGGPMTTADPDVSVESVVARGDRLRSGAKKTLSSPWASLAAIVIAVLWTIPTAGLLISSFRPEDDVKTSGWWTVLTDPSVHPRQLRAGARRARHRPRDLLRQHDRDHDPGGADPDQPRHHRGLRVRVDEVPGPRLPVRRVFALQIVPIQVTMIPLLKLYVQPPFNLSRWPAPTLPAAASTRSGSRTRSSRCRWRSTCCTTSCRRSRAS